MTSRVARHLISFTASGPDGALASFRVGLRDFPYLADHGFQDLTVLPGAFYLELALSLQIERLQLASGRILRAEFLSPLILAAEPSEIAVQLTKLADRHYRYEFRERGSGGAEQPVLATLEVDSNPGAPLPARRAAGLAQSQPLRRAEIYQRLRSNGNQYGPLFQGISGLRSGQDRATADLAVPVNERDWKDHHLYPVGVDCAVQLLGTAGWDNGRTYVLRSIGEVRFQPGAMAATGALEARWNPPDQTGLTGDAAVFDEAGAMRVELREVRLAYLDAARPPQVVIASTFTAEPIEPALEFWSQAAGDPVRVEFAPYAQVFQELLKPDSQFRRNRSGLNVLLLNLADWLNSGGRGDSPVEPAGRSDWNGLETHTLPNGLEVAHLNRHETEYVYREIFEDQCYLRHGIHLSGAKHVIDIGANIGLFSLFVRSQSPQAEVFSFEPSPIAFRALSANCDRYGAGLHPFNVGVSERRGSAQLTFYEKSSVFSSFHPNQAEDRQAIRAVVANMVQNELRDPAAPVDDFVEELMTDRLDSQTFDCPLVSVSDIIRDNGLQFVDLLKIDAEKCELEILRGVEPAHWPLIGQVVIEVHDASGKDVAEVRSILSAQGFQCAVEEEHLLTGSGLFNVYATRPGTPGPSVVTDLRNKADQLFSALSGFAADASSPTLIVVAPPPARRGAEAAALKLVEDDLLRRAAAVPGVTAVGSRTLLGRYPGTDWFNAQTDRLGHIPYSDGGFAALGTTIFRAFAARCRAPYKVIALDCDHTLWDGGVGEDGPTGVNVSAGRRLLQEFMVRQMQAGMLLALCSKNDAASVWAVFAENSGMVLKREQIAAERINWSAKSENLRSLAAELNVGLDSFILVDDNPVECAEVRAHCPGPLVIELPADAERAAGMLEQVWAFDQAQVTAEDSRRTRMMQESAERERLRGAAPCLADFIAGLELVVDSFEPGPAELPRLAQLTQRTNQFNLTTIRRTEAEVRQFLERRGGRALAVSVRDRFGDYGLVGAVLYEAQADCYRLDTFLLSCRVLGRGVEHQVMAELGRRAQAEGKARIELTVGTTAKNLPARNFVAEVTGGKGLVLPAAVAAAFQMSPGLAPPAATGLEHPKPYPRRPGDVKADTPEARRSASSSDQAGVDPRRRVGGDSAGGGAAAGRPAKPDFRPEQFKTAAEIAAAIEGSRLRAAGFDPAAPLPADLTGQLLHLWRKILGNPRLGLDDNFLDAGGTSLKAVQLVAAIRRELQRPVSVVAFFEAPTVRRLSEKLEPSAAPVPAAGPPANDAMERGARRNQRLGRPRD